MKQNEQKKNRPTKFTMLDASFSLHNQIAVCWNKTEKYVFVFVFGGYYIFFSSLLYNNRKKNHPCLLNFKQLLVISKDHVFDCFY